MSKAIKKIEKSDLLPSADYVRERKKIRKELIEFKKNRRIALGPHCTFYFESFETILAQVQEMLYIEKGGDEQLKDELNAYNPLIPNGRELIATVMFEIDNPIIRNAFLAKMGGVEKTMFIKFGENIVKGTPEEDVDRTSLEGKASSVHFIHFPFTYGQIADFKKSEVDAYLGIDHREYSHIAKLNEKSIKSLVDDFN